jgi:hypothetical protein
MPYGAMRQGRWIRAAPGAKAAMEALLSLSVAEFLKRGDKAVYSGCAVLVKAGLSGARSRKQAGALGRDVGVSRRDVSSYLSARPV